MLVFLLVLVLTATITAVALSVVVKENRELALRLRNERDRAAHLSEQASVNARLAEIAHELNAASELSLHRTLTRAFGRALDATRVVLYQRNEDGDYAMRAQHAAEGIVPFGSEHGLPGFSLVETQDGSISIRKENQPVSDRDGGDDKVSQMDSDLAEFARRVDRRSILAARAGLGENEFLLAVFRAESHLETDMPAFSQSEQRFLERVAELAGRVFDHASRRAHLTTDASVRGSLLRASQALMAAGDLETVFELATSVAAPLAGSRSGAILSLGRDGWRVDAQSGFAPPLDLSAIVELTSFFDRAVRDRGPVLVDHDLRLPGEGDGGAVLPLLVLPVAYGREVLGVFLFQADKSSRGAPTWTAEEWSRARIVTELTASAWKNARKYQELERTARGLERQLRESQKRELVGMLAGGIAHDFNNLLGGIVGSAALLRSQVGDSGAAAKYLETIQKAAHRGSALAGRLVAAVSTSSDVSDPPSTTRCLPFSPNEFVSDTLDLLSQTLPKKIHIERVLDERVPAITMDPGAFQQIILNLCVNARDAMPNGGRLSIETSVETSAGGSPDVFCLCVTDSGSGMDEITKKRLFEPFYTTKGTTSSGLGLSVVRDIVKSLDGSIEVESSVGHGARFLIKVPVATEMVEGDVETPTPTPTPKTQVSADARARLASTRELWNGEGEMILLVDDELVLLEIGRQILEEQGYRVKTASSGEDALRILRSERGTISLVILDLVMPGLDGYETYHEIRRKDEALPVLISSGMTSERTARELLEDGAAGFIPKPYDVSDLAEAVFEALHGRAPSLVH